MSTTTTTTRTSRLRSFPSTILVKGTVPDLPTTYVPPKTGLLSILPTAWVPYAELMRLDKRAGIYLFYWPYLHGILYAAVMLPVAPAPSSVFSVALIFLFGTILMRGAACSWNDAIDADLDRKVERCKNRPCARRAVSVSSAIQFTGEQALVGWAILRLLPWGVVPMAMINAVLLGCYPFMKRLTNYPQAFLGIPVSLGVPIGAAGLAVDVLGASADVNMIKAVLALCLSVMMWTISSDTVYGHQDVADDAKAGIKSMAVRFRESTKPLLTLMVIVQVVSLLATGIWSGFGLWYYLGTCGGAAAAMGAMIHLVDLKNPASCWWWFVNGQWLTGGAMASGLLLEYVLRTEPTSWVPEGLLAGAW